MRVYLSRMHHAHVHNTQATAHTTRGYRLSLARALSLCIISGVASDAAARALLEGKLGALSYSRCGPSMCVCVRVSVLVGVVAAGSAHTRATRAEQQRRRSEYWPAAAAAAAWLGGAGTREREQSEPPADDGGDAVGWESEKGWGGDDRADRCLMSWCCPGARIYIGPGGGCSLVARVLEGRGTWWRWRVGCGWCLGGRGVWNCLDVK